MLKPGKTYQETVERFRWEIPDYYNIAVDICDKHAQAPSRRALIYHDEETDTVTEYTFAQLKELSNRLANSLQGLGLGRGDRIGIVLTQRPETALTHLAAYKLGAITIPLFSLFGPDALEYRLGDSEAKMVVVDEENLEKIVAIRPHLPSLQQIIVVASKPVAEFPVFADLLQQGAETFSPLPTRADDPALIIYTSGTTGSPKGALHAHRVLLGHLPGFEFPHNFAPQPGDCFWTPADWAWIGGLIDILFPAWHHGLPVVAYRARKFDPEKAFALLARHRIRNAFLPPTALKMMREVPHPRERYRFSLRTVGSGGESLGEEVLAWGREELGVTINEFYGQTEVNLVIGNCHEVMEIKPGSMGKPIPGHQVAIIQEDGSPTPVGEIGEIAIKRPDPVMFLGYWNNPQATAEKFIGDWACTGDLARMDEEGYFWFMGRKDDLIISSGYRIGPAEVEDTILKHPAVSMVAVIGAPHAIRGTIVKAFIRLKPGFQPSDALTRSIQDFVKARLAAHEYPREIEFVEALPLTTTGKIMRRVLRQQEEERYRQQRG
ncbi:MAG: AMP-dependent synthetase [Nitrospinota bacterium]|nr:MAG: AMP-dependent synthetase [Nitrospinota bacterium]